ncbi:hypothetical protein LCL95_15275 [Bacillus timonensis]|nr:hypothetical protein [Bacillus timonensis]
MKYIYTTWATFMEILVLLSLLLIFIGYALTKYPIEKLTVKIQTKMYREKIRYASQL